MAPIISSTRISKVAVVGAGPGGLAAAKYLAAEKSFAQIDVFEQRETVGGVWCATPNETEDANFTVPRTAPSKTPNHPVWTRGEEKKKFQFVSPIYDQLDTNIPHTVMNYSDQKFPSGSSLFPRHAVVREYLERYADDIRPLLRLGVQVLDVRPTKRTLDAKWSVTTKDFKSQQHKTAIYDAVVVANGHYDDPFIPNITGINAWNDAYPNAISHSKLYRRPNQYKQKRVIVVGNSASGIDLSVQISAVSKSPLFVSEKSTSAATSDLVPGIEYVPEIAEFVIQDRAVRFSDGHTEKNVDYVIFCTGYMYSYPFLSALDPPVVGTGEQTQNLYQQIFYYPIPTLSFVGLPQRIVPFPVSEAQASVIARVLSQRLALPMPITMKVWEEVLIKEKGSGKSFHTLAFPLDAAYINYLHDWALKALKKDDLMNDGAGKIPPYWGEEQQWIRERFPLIKMASRKLGAERHRVTSVRELGFDFNQWKNETQAEEKLI